MDESVRPNVSLELFLRCIKEEPGSIDETELYFFDDSQKDVYCILGYLSGIDPAYPYWVGYGCDIKDGAAFSTAEDLIEAEIFHGKSLVDRWDSVYVSTIGMIPVEEWLVRCSFHNQIIAESGYWHL